MLFETRIQRCDEEDKLIKENYLVEAESFSDAEKRVMNELQLSQDDVLTIRRSNIAETFFDKDAGDYYRIKLIREYTDDNGKTKTSSWYMMLRAVSHEEATNRVLTIIQQGYDMKVSDIVRTKIIALI